MQRSISNFAYAITVKRTDSTHTHTLTTNERAAQVIEFENENRRLQTWIKAPYFQGLINLERQRKTKENFTCEVFFWQTFDELFI